MIVGSRGISSGPFKECPAGKSELVRNRNGLVKVLTLRFFQIHVYVRTILSSSQIISKLCFWIL